LPDDGGTVAQDSVSPTDFAAASPVSGEEPARTPSVAADASPSPGRQRPQTSGRTVHGVLQTIRGMCSDECSHVLIDQALAAAVELAKDIEAERDWLREQS
jgi:hypothetical protein